MFKTVIHGAFGLFVVVMLCFGSIHYQWTAQANNSESHTYLGHVGVDLTIPQPVLNTLVPQYQATLQQPAQGHILFYQAILQLVQNITRPLLLHILHTGAQQLEPIPSYSTLGKNTPPFIPYSE